MTAYARHLPAILLPILLALAPLASAQAPAEQLLPADNLQQSAAAARAEGKPLMLMFSLPECPYCKVVRRNYLLPLLRNPVPAERPQIRELTMTSRKAIIDFDGTVTTPVAVAKRYQVTVAPTLVFVGPAGEKLIDSLVGGDHSFYDAYLERALSASRQALAAPAR